MRKIRNYKLRFSGEFIPTERMGFVKEIDWVRVGLILVILALGVALYASMQATNDLLNALFNGVAVYHV